MWRVDAAVGRAPTKARTVMKYTNVRRNFTYLDHSIEEGTQWGGVRAKRTLAGMSLTRRKRHRSVSCQRRACPF